MNDQELAGLSAEVREAVSYLFAVPECHQAISTIHAGLLRLVGECNCQRLEAETYTAKYQAMRERAERAEAELVGANREIEHQVKERRKVEAELAALKRRIEEAPVYKCDADVISGRDYDYISAVLIHDDPGFQYPDVDGKRVALLPVGGE